MRCVTGFTLIETLVVVAIVTILATIAIPNFLEAQTRSKVSRALVDMRSIVAATAAYRVDYNSDPTPNFSQTRTRSTGEFDRPWWGYASHLLTTPTAYIDALPADIFPDSENSFLRNGWLRIDPKRNRADNRPYMAVVRTSSIRANGPKDYMPLGMTSDGIPWPEGLTLDYAVYMRRAPSVFISAGPDHSAWGFGTGPIYSGSPYDPTNGTISRGEIYMLE